MVEDKTGFHEKLREKSVLPYEPSWIDRIHQVVSNVGIPFLLFYIIVWLVFLSLLTLLRWRDQVVPAGHLGTTDIIMSGTGIFFVALIHYLDQWAGRKLERFRHVIDMAEEDFKELHYRLSTLPARPTLIASLVTLGFGVLTYALVPESYAFLNINFSAPSSALQLINFFLSWFTFGALCYHAYHQLRLGSLATANYLQINLFNLNPVYTFAGLTLRSALGWLVMAYAWALSTPNLVHNVIIIATILFMQVVAILTFVLPLLGAHDRIVQKKTELLDDISVRMEKAVNEMSHVGDDFEKERLSKLSELLTALTLAEERIRKISTWPWRAGALNSLVTAILLPNVIWLLQSFAGKLLFR